MFYFNIIDCNKVFFLKICFNFDCIDLDDGVDVLYWSVCLFLRY